MDLRRLHYLQLIVRHGSFTAAAREAGITQPAISHAMRRLQEELGTALFVRAGRMLQPTPAALQAAERAASLQHAMAALMARGARASSPPPAVLRVGLAAAAALLYGPLIEQAWRERHPGGLVTMVTLNAQEMLDSLQRGGLDVVIAPRPRRYRATSMHWQLLHTSAPLVFCRAGHPLAAARTLKTLSTAAWAVTAIGITRAGNVLEEAHAVRGLSAPRIHARCPDYPTLVNLVAHTDLLCVIPHPAILQGLESSRIVPLRMQEAMPRYDVGIAWLRASHDDVLHTVEQVLQAHALPMNSAGRARR